MSGRLQRNSEEDSLTRPVDSVVFDLGNVLTLVDEERGARDLSAKVGRSPEDVFAAVFAPERKRALEKGEQSWGAFVRECCALLGSKIPEADFRAIYESVLSPNTAIFPLVEKALTACSVGLCSNTSPVHWEVERGRLPFAQQLDPAVLSYAVGALKPDAEIYRCLIEAAGLSPERIVFIDDREDNVEGARRQGIQALRFEDVSRLQHELELLEVL